MWRMWNISGTKKRVWVCVERGFFTRFCFSCWPRLAFDRAVVAAAAAATAALAAGRKFVVRSVHGQQVFRRRAYGFYVVVCVLIFAFQRKLTATDRKRRAIWEAARRKEQTSKCYRPIGVKHREHLWIWVASGAVCNSWDCLVLVKQILDWFVSNSSAVRVLLGRFGVLFLSCWFNKLFLVELIDFFLLDFYYDDIKQTIKCIFL